MKIERYDPPRSFPTKPLPWVQCDDGDWCKSEDVAGLEAKCSELEAKCAELISAAKDVITRWDSPQWKMEEHTADFINRLRESVAKCEGLP